MEHIWTYVNMKEILFIEVKILLIEVKILLI